MLRDAVRVLVTRAVKDAESFARALAAAGHEPVCVPLVAREVHLHNIAHALACGPFEWLILTSPAAVEAVVGLVGLPNRAAAVGPATAERARAAGIEPELVPSVASGLALANALGDLRGKRVLYPHAEQITPGTLESLRATGADVVEFVAYRNVEPDGIARALARSGPVDVVALYSASAATRYARGCEDAAISPARVVAIGESTARAARRAGLQVSAVADQPTTEAMLAAIDAAVKSP